MGRKRIGAEYGFGYILGANLRPTDNLSIGVSYRSEIDYELEGTADWTVPRSMDSSVRRN